MSLDDLHERVASFRGTGNTFVVWSDEDVARIAGRPLWKLPARQWRVSEAEPRIRLFHSGVVKDPSAEVSDFCQRIHEFRSLIACSKSGPWGREITADSLLPVVNRAKAVKDWKQSRRIIRELVSALKGVHSINYRHSSAEARNAWNAFEPGWVEYVDRHPDQTVSWIQYTLSLKMWQRFLLEDGRSSPSMLRLPCP